MAPAVDYSPRVFGPLLIQRGLSTLLVLPIYRQGQLATPSSGTISIYDATGTAIVSAASVTVSDGVATYSVSSGTTSSLQLGEGWRTEWVLAMPDARSHTFREAAALVRCLIYPPASDSDLWRRCPSLSPSHPGVQSAVKIASYQPYLDEAWRQISERLQRAGRRPWLVIGSSQLVTAHTLLTLALVFEDLASRNNPAYLDQARMYRDQYEADWGQLQLTYDQADGGGTSAVVVPGARTLWTTRRSGRGIPWPG
jgi:hypothetical protein